MLKVNLLHRCLSSFDRVERVKLGLMGLRESTDEAGKAVGLSGHSVRVGLSEGRESIIEKLEGHIEEGFEERFP